ncbi:MAG: hypothetical protein WCK17_02850 [Verrucomicrobiota bacterium]
MNDNLNPEVTRRQFEVAIADLRTAFDSLLGAMEEQFEQVISLGWSGDHEDAVSFLKYLEHQSECFVDDALQAACDVVATAEAMEFTEHEKLAQMKLVWAKLRAEGVPRDQWPMLAELPWDLQFRAQAEADCNRD